MKFMYHTHETSSGELENAIYCLWVIGRRVIYRNRSKHQEL